MKPTAQATRRRLRPSRRGITLVEMLVTVAVLVLLMTMLVQIFQGATGSLSAAKSFQELDDSMRRLDATIRSDLNGVTAHLTPPLNPKDGLGYFEYGENAFADLQGEDSDDYVRFTAKAPEGRPFRGRALMEPPIDPTTGLPMDLTNPSYSNQLMLYKKDEPVLITSDYAEIIYFVRNGNLYRRVLLIAPERQGSILQMKNNTVPGSPTSPPPYGWKNPFQFAPGTYGGVRPMSWQGVNDLSARPATSGPSDGSGMSRIVLNTLGDLTNRENRFAYPRFCNDYNLDGVADDFNVDGNGNVVGDGVPDFYPTLYLDSTGAFSTALQSLIFSPGYVLPPGTRFSAMAFPYIFPGAYSQPETDQNWTQLGWIHSPIPDQTQYQFSIGMPNSNPLLYLQRLNHNPLDVGDNLYRPDDTNPPNAQYALAMFQTWWGFPTARETLSLGWVDPTWQLNLNGGAQPWGLNPNNPAGVFNNLVKVDPSSAELLPPMSDLLPTPPAPSVTDAARENPQLYSDKYGFYSNIITGYGTVNIGGFNHWRWTEISEPDLILTGVRSFDVKAYDDLYGGYVDLGWKNDVRMIGNQNEFNMNTTNTQNGYNFLTGTPRDAFSPFVGGGSLPTLSSTFGHEGRMPPLTTDNRADAQFHTVVPLPSAYDYYLTNNYYPGYAYPANIGDNAPNINRLRRVFDTWSTDYTTAPAHAINAATGVVYGPPTTPPAYPSYPAPYPAPLKGIQIQVRVVDPTNQHIKQITIRHDFSDRL